MAVFEVEPVIDGMAATARVAVEGVVNMTKAMAQALRDATGMPDGTTYADLIKEVKRLRELERAYRNGELK